MEKVIAEAKIEGRLAYYDGQSEDDNPYPDAFHKFAAWLSGFLEAENEEKEEE
jgi:hypothetical protein